MGESIYNSYIQNTQGTPKLNNSIKTQLNGQDPTTDRSSFIVLEAGQRLTVFSREHTGHSKYPLPTTQETTLHMDITRWSIHKLGDFYSLQSKMAELYTVSKNKMWS